LAKSLRLDDPEDYHFDTSGMFAGAVLDWHPFMSGWRLTGGFYYVDLELESRPTQGATLNGTTYSAADVGTVRTRVNNAHSISPYLGFGYDSAAVNYGGASLALGIDIGAIYTGDPNVRITTDRSVGGLAADLVAESAELKQKIDSFYGFYPVFMMSGKLSF
jgi:hypothetical protein